MVRDVVRGQWAACLSAAHPLFLMEAIDNCLSATFLLILMEAIDTCLSAAFLLILMEAIDTLASCRLHSSVSSGKASGL